MNSTFQPTAAGDAQAVLFRRAYEEVEDELLHLTSEQLLVVNLDVERAVTVVLGALPGIATLEPELEQMPGWEPGMVATLKRYALATGYAQTLYARASVPPRALKNAARRAMQARSLLVTDLRALAARGLLRSSFLDRLKRKGLNGYRALPFELLALTGLMRELLPEVSGRTAVTAADLDEADRLAEELLLIIAERDHAPARRTSAADSRQRAYSLLVPAYDEVRLAVQWIRRKVGDAEKVAPSLYGPRERRERIVEGERGADVETGMGIQLQDGADDVHPG